MIIQTDTRQKMNQKHHKIKENYFKSKGHTVIHSKMLVGDYCIPGKGNVVVDTKQSPTELYGNLITDHVRFRNECITAMECGIKLYILIENKDNINCIDDILKWKNPQYYRYQKDLKKGIKRKPPASNQQLLKIMYSMQKKYGVEFLFCKTEVAGEIIIKLLTETEDKK